MHTDTQPTKDLVQEYSEDVSRLREEVHKVLVGQEDMLNHLLVALFTGGHVLLEGLPGLAKTTAIKALASAIDCKFQRIQFTPDLLPADLIGTMIYNPKEGSFGTRKGPIFANLILADEINRAPSKVQSALLEAMQEHQVTIGDTTYALEDPFLVLATQNPIEQEGTYPLPEAQVDRFMLKVAVDYPNRDEEREVIGAALTGAQQEIVPVLSHDRLREIKGVVQQIYLDEKIKDYVLDLVAATRKPENYKLRDLKPLIQCGASPRASINLCIAARANAFLEKRDHVLASDVKDVAMEVMRHRILLTYEAEAEEKRSDDIVRLVLDAVPVP